MSWALVVLLAMIAGWNIFQWLSTPRCEEFHCVTCSWSRNAQAGRISVAVSAMLVVFAIAIS
jgi:hypothetical protein